MSTPVHPVAKPLVNVQLDVRATAIRICFRVHFTLLPLHSRHTRKHKLTITWEPVDLFPNFCVGGTNKLLTPSPSFVRRVGKMQYRWLCIAYVQSGSQTPSFSENSMQYVPPDGFFGIQTVQVSISAGALPQTALGSLRRSPIPLVGWGEGYPLPFPACPTPWASCSRRI